MVDRPGGAFHGLAVMPPPSAGWSPRPGRPVRRGERALHQPSREPPGFIVRQSSAALFPSGHDRERQRTAALSRRRGTVACQFAPPRFMAGEQVRKEQRTLREPALTPALSRPTGEGAPANAGAGEGDDCRSRVPGHGRQAKAASPPAPPLTSPQHVAHRNAPAVITASACAFLCLWTAPVLAQNPVPFISQPLVPASVVPGGPAFTLTVNGANFVPASVVTWNGAPRPTTCVSRHG